MDKLLQKTLSGGRNVLQRTLCGSQCVKYINKQLILLLI